MKPDWKDAPEWANWVAMDYSGDWYWFECEPTKNRGRFWDNSNGMFEAVENFEEWQETKEKRP